nr:C-C motif chemokine ligand 16 [Rousettus aegyptiacus]
MKVSVAALFLLILILTMTSAFCRQAKSPESVNLSHTCCLKYHEKIIPRKLLMGHRKALGCYLPAIIFVTKKNREVCANPNEKWVQDYIDDPNVPLLRPRNMPQVKSIRS